MEASANGILLLVLRAPLLVGLLDRSNIHRVSMQA
jgi:hypothetical protein